MKTTIALIVAGTVALLVVARFLNSGITPKFVTAEVTRGALSLGVDSTGMVEPVEIIDVGARIVGCIKSFGDDRDRPGKTIDYRSRVRNGDVLAQLDDLLYKADWDKAKINLRIAKAELNGCLAKQKQAKRNLARATGMHGPNGAISEADFEKAGADMETADAEVAMAQAKVAQAENAENLAQINLTYTTIRSPVDGVVIDRKVNVGQTVVAGMNAPSLFLLARDTNRMQVCAFVNEADIGDIHARQQVTFTVDTYRERNLHGTVAQIRHNASLANSVVMYPVVIDVDNSDGKLLPYLTAKLHFEVVKHDNVILAPSQALRWQPTWSQITPSARAELSHSTVTSAASPSDGDEAEEPRVELKSPTVWVLARDGLVRPVSVSTGLTDGMRTEILRGALEPGDTVVVRDVREVEADFVKSFVEKVTAKNE